MKLYLHPLMSVADAAIAAYDAGNHLAGATGKVAVVPGRDDVQYGKALQIKLLHAVARGVESA